jgi:hypothetical protein
MKRKGKNGWIRLQEEFRNRIPLMQDLSDYLKGGDLRSIGRVEDLIGLIKNATNFDLLFEYLHSEDRLLVICAADAVEKISVEHPEWLAAHKKEILHFLQTAQDQEFKWHLAQIVTRLELAEDELRKVWMVVSNWAKNEKESKIVRVNSLQALYNLSHKHIHLKKAFERSVA